MTTRIEIIAQLDDEITRLERARDFLVAALASAPNELKKTAKAIASARKVKTAVPVQKRKLPAKTAAPAATELQSQVVVAPPPPPVPQPKEEPQIKRVPPRRRME